MGLLQVQLWLLFVPALLLVLSTRHCKSEENEYPCRDREVEEEWVAEGGTLSPADGAIRYRIGLQADIPEKVRKAARTAVEQWNMHSRLSNIVLELDESADEPHEADLWILRTKNSVLSGSCARFRTLLKRPYKIGGVLYSVDGYESWVASNPEDAPMVIAHEIGHFLGLANATPLTNTIMAAGYDTGSGSCQAYAMAAVAKRPTVEDAINAGKCVWKHHKKFSAKVPPAKLTPKMVPTKSSGTIAGLFFSLLSLIPTPSTAQVGPEPIPDAARQVSGNYVVELSPAEEFVARSLEGLVKDTGLIVTARLVQGTSYLSKDELTIATVYQARVLEFIKGPESLPSKPWLINIVMPGGKYQLPDGRSAEVRIRDQKPLVAGEKYVFFLQRANEADAAMPAEPMLGPRYVPRLGAQGVFEVSGLDEVKPHGDQISPALREFRDIQSRMFVGKIQVALKQHTVATR
jgi:hypothetical protein